MFAGAGVEKRKGSAGEGRLSTDVQVNRFVERHTE
jgi:hypothetical protein